jgi:NOL1/NOP2/sun family putative RNA methylase
MKEHYEIKPEFEKRLRLLFENEEDFQKFEKIIRTEAPDSIRCNTLKISPEELKFRLEKKGWKIKQPFLEFPEVMIIENRLSGGELGKSKEHLLGYYYVQDISSMLPLMALKIKPGESFLDLCASPGSKTTQAAAMMQNRGVIIANDSNLGRISILSANLERCGVTNTIITRMDGAFLCQKLLKETKIKFDKILVDAPCSGEGTLRKSPKTLLMWNEKFIKNLAGIQKKLTAEAIKILKIGGDLVYSTCTHSPEENEEIIDFLISQFDIEIQEINLPLKLRPGLCQWQGKSLDKEVCKSRRLYPHDNDTEGFFLCKIKKLSEKNCEARK